ncbi:MAG TPA: LysM peptidoglycan-binding domain-containing protein [Aquificae bacterium]|nr:LysM peptidoglycan-binding domain-containing protein [Aquificota bacterium]
MWKKLLILFLLISQSKAYILLKNVRYSIAPEKERYVLDFSSRLKKDYIKVLKRKNRICVYTKNIKASYRFPKVVYLYNSKILKKLKLFKRVNPKVCFYIKTPNYIFNYFIYKNKFVLDFYKKDIERLKTKQRQKFAENLRKQHKFIVVLDPGHGGFDSGAVWPIKSKKPYLKEKDIVLKLAKLVKRHLEKHPNVKVILTRNKDVYVSLYERSKIATDYGADIFVSLHVDSLPRSSRVSGITIYTSSPRYKKYSQKMVKVFSKEPVPVKAVFENLAPSITYSFSDDLAYYLKKHIKKVYKRKVSIKTHPKNIIVIRTPGRPSVLIEAGFITSKYDRSFYINKRKLNKLAKAIADGIYTYLKSYSDRNFCKIKKLVYYVKKGDTLWRVSKKFKVSIDKLKKWNNLKSYTLYQGQKLFIYKKVCN